MSFDDDVERLKKELANGHSAGHAVDSGRAISVSALERLRPLLERRIASRRITFSLEDGAGADDDPSIQVLYAATGDELGAIVFEDGAYAFESDDDDYFANVPDTDHAAEFVDLMYECLKIGLPAYELDLGEA